MAMKGQVRFPGYRTGGVPKKKGLRNKRNKVKAEEQRKLIAKRRREERLGKRKGSRALESRPQRKERPWGEERSFQNRPFEDV